MATVKPCNAQATKDSVLFQRQRKDKGGWNKLGRAVAVDKSCKAKIKEKIKEKSVFRALSISATRETLAISPSVTVKTK